jgi:CSLREA domain-containing protein
MFVVFSLLISVYGFSQTTNIHAATLTVTKTADTNDGICNADCSLREAIAIANDNDTILFETANFVKLTQGELIITRNLTIAGTNETKLTITRDISASPAARIFYIQPGASLTLTNTIVTGGTAPLDVGGGIFNGGSLTLINTMVTNNSATQGGGIENRGTLNITNSTISNNFALSPQPVGGGINNSGSMTIINSTISNNEATTGPMTGGGIGGGINNFGTSPAIMRNVTVANNFAGNSGGGIKGGTVTLGNTIIADNSSSSGPDIWGATVNSEGYNLLENIFAVTISGTTTGNILSIDPQFDPNGLRDNGGGTKTIALQQNSPAVDKGKRTIAGITTDQRGLTRPVDNSLIPNASGGDGSDIGAFEVQGGPIISINNVSLNEGNSGTTAFNFTVSLSSAAAQTVTANFATANATATIPSDYQSASGQLSFAVGETSKQVTVLVNGDLVIESNETFTVNLSNAANATISVSNGQGTGTILNDDVAGSLQFSSTNFSVNENAGQATITITRTSGIGSGVSVIYATQNGTATAGQDYTATSGSLTFEANETSKTFTIPIINDTIVEPNETVSLALFNPTAGGTLGTPNTATLTIVDDDQIVRRTIFDFDGDGRADLTVFRASNGFWYELSSQNNSFIPFKFGQNGDRIAPADYDGDGRTDFAVFRDVISGAGNRAYFYITNSSDGSFRPEQFGATGDIPVSGDWDGDGKGDLAVYRDGSLSGGQGYFFYRPSSAPGVDFRAIAWGTNGDKPVVGDFDGDSKLDAAVYRPSAGTWYILQSSNNQFVFQGLGIATDIPVPADFDGDGKTNIAVFRPSNGTWYTSPNPQTNYGAVQFGATGDLPAPADYDGDGRADIAVFRPSNGTWYLLRTTQGFTGVQFGNNEDKPVPNAYIR